MECQGLIERSGRHTIAYGPLVINKELIGILGFSYNREQRNLWHPSYVKVLLNLCALALDRGPREASHAVCEQLYDAGDADKLTALGTIYGQHGDPEAALQPLQRAGRGEWHFRDSIAVG